MKRINTTKLLVLLLSLCLITSSFVGGTLAKYVTTGEATDSARVAKWGITFADTASETFSLTYDTNDSNKDVYSIGGDDVVAPGTSGSATFQMSGQPETKYQVTMTMDEAINSDVFLVKGNYAYPADAGYVGMNIADTDFVTTDSYLTDAKYLPIEYTVALTSTNGTITSSPNGSYRTLAEVKTKLDAVKVDFDANKGCDVSLTISWKWAFDNQNDKMDTVLGDIIANNTDLIIGASGSSTSIAYKVIMTATQIGE